MYFLQRKGGEKAVLQLNKIQARNDKLRKSV